MQENNACLHDLFASHAFSAGDAVAVVDGEQSIVYRDLYLRAMSLAASLRRHGAGLESPVGLHLPRSIDMIVAMLGILQAGGAYVPLSPSEAPDRLSEILHDSGIETVVTSEATIGALERFSGTRLIIEAQSVIAGPESSMTWPRPAPDNVAYIIYTSGTTGRPKGIAVPHRAAVRIVRSGIYGDFGPGETFLQACPLSFDASVFEIWACLANGSRLVLMPHERSSPDAITECVRQQGVTVLWLTPSLFNQMVDNGYMDDCRHCQIVIGGEVLSTPHLARAMRSGATRLANGYGPTEAGVFTCCHRFDEMDLTWSPPPVGTPLPGTEVRVLDRDLRPVETGQPGELCIGGNALARGYHRQPGLTAKAFVPDPFSSQPGARLYRSGDLARELPGGIFQVLGRNDDQVKIRGNRVELGEVEAALVSQPQISQAAAIDRLRGRERVLVAYIVPVEGQHPTASQLRHRLARRLPEYMIPSEFYRLARLPLTRHGKADRAALRIDKSAPRLDTSPTSVPVSGDLEEVIANVWSEVLGVATVGLDDNYFDMGGTSLTIKEVQVQLQDLLGIRLPSTALYEYPTIRQFARGLTESGVVGAAR